MSEIESKPALPTENEGLASSVDALRKQLQTTLWIVIILSVAVNWFLLYQFVITRKQLLGFEQMVADYQRTGVPWYIDFHKKLTDFAKAHPDFAPVLAKYPIPVTPAAATNPAAATAQPAKGTSPAPGKALPAKTPTPAPPPKN
jgi:hypothetical protein